MAEEVLTLRLDRITALKQVRFEVKEDDALRELAASIRVHGVRQPILVRPNPEIEGGYIIICGERRYRASVLAGREDIPAIVPGNVDFNDPGQLLELQVIENSQRQDLDVMELARACRELMEDRGYSGSRLAERLGKSPAYVSYMTEIAAMEGYPLELYDRGLLSNSYRTIYDFIKLYNSNPGGVREYLDQYIEDMGIEDGSRFLDRGVVKDIRGYLESVGEAVEAVDNSGFESAEETSGGVEEPRGGEADSVGDGGFEEAGYSSVENSEPAESSAAFDSAGFAAEETESSAIESSVVEETESSEAETAVGGARPYACLLVLYEGREYRLTGEGFSDTEVVLEDADGGRTGADVTRLTLLKVRF